MPTTVYNKDGQPTSFDFDVDARFALRYAGYTATPPEGKEQEESKPLTGEESRKLADVSERARLGGAVTPEERELLNKRSDRDPRLDEKGAVHEVGSYPEGEHPGALGGAVTSEGSVPGSPPGGLGGAVANAGSPGAPVTKEQQSTGGGPESQQKVDTFNPASADRLELRAWLRDHGETVENATSTDRLREHVYEKMGSHK